MAIKALHYNNIDFNIEEDGEINRNSTWHLMDDTDPVGNWTSLLSDAKTWAGNIGDDWRVPTAASTGYTSDTAFVVTGIDFRALSRYMYEVTFTGKRKFTTAEMVNLPDLRINENGEKEKSATWRVSAASLDGFLPAIASVISWAGSTYLCREINAVSTGAAQYQVSIVAKDMTSIMVGNPRRTINGKYEKEVTASWNVATSAYAGFVSSNDIGASASAWAGSDYYVTDISAEKIGLLGYVVTLTAKHISVRLIDVSVRREFVENNDRGYAISRNSYTGRWQTDAAGLPGLLALSGSSAAEWAEDGQIIYEVSSIKLSENEYEVTMQTRNPNDNLGGGGGGGGSLVTESRADLDTRTDYSIGSSSFTLTAAMCGWREIGGIYTLIPDWSAGTECPFITSVPLPRSMIGRTIDFATMSVTVYIKGEPRQFMSEYMNWFNTNYIFDGTIMGVPGNWRKLSIDSPQRVADNDGVIYTKITRTDINAGTGRKWNPSYIAWRN